MCSLDVSGVSAVCAAMALGAAAMFMLSLLCAALRAFRVWLEERAQSESSPPPPVAATAAGRPQDALLREERAAVEVEAAAQHNEHSYVQYCLDTVLY